LGGKVWTVEKELKRKGKKTREKREFLKIAEKWLLKNCIRWEVNTTKQGRGMR